MTTRFDMLVELASDQINQIRQMFDEDEYQDVHEWLHPILYKILCQNLADLSDEDLKIHYCDQLGVDILYIPPLSSDDAEEEIYSQAEEKERRPMPRPSRMERSSIPDIYPISDEKSMAEMAATLRGIVRREETVHGLQPTTEIRIPMRLLLRLVHGKDCLR